MTSSEIRLRKLKLRLRESGLLTTIFVIMEVNNSKSMPKQIHCRKSNTLNDKFTVLQIDLTGSLSFYESYMINSQQMKPYATVRGAQIIT